jgi:hypothetical protein
MKTIRFCEFTGDGTHFHDEVGCKKLCEWAGFQYCTLHNKPLTLTPDGWQVCCKECTTPIQVKEQS